MTKGIWAARIQTWRWKLPQLLEAVEASATRLPQALPHLMHEDLRFSGFITPQGLTSSLQFGYSARYRLEDEALEVHLRVLVEELRRKGVRYKMLPLLWNDAPLSALLGLREGFSASAKVHAIDKVRKALPSMRIRPIEIFSARSSGEVYREPACLIQTDSSAALGHVYDLARLIQQEFVPVVELDRTYTYNTDAE